MQPLLALTSDGAEHSLTEIREALAEEFQLSQEERNELLPSGRQRRFDNRVAWAKVYLRMAGLITTTRRVSYPYNGARPRSPREPSGADRYSVAGAVRGVSAVPRRLAAVAARRRGDVRAPRGSGCNTRGATRRSSASTPTISARSDPSRQRAGPCPPDPAPRRLAADAVLPEVSRSSWW